MPRVSIRALNLDRRPLTAADQSSAQRRQFLLGHFRDHHWTVGEVLSYVQGRAYECALPASGRQGGPGGNKNTKREAVLRGLLAMQEEIAACIAILQGVS